MGMNSLTRSPSKRVLCIVGAIVLIALTLLQFDHSISYPSNWRDTGVSRAQETGAQPSNVPSSHPSQNAPHPGPPEKTPVPRPAGEHPHPKPEADVPSKPATEDVRPHNPAEDGPTLGVIDEVHVHTLEEDTRNSTLGFGKIFVVGLPDRTDRRDGITLQSGLSDMAIEFIDGVRGDAVPDKALPMLHPNSRPPPAVVGSWRAHMNAIREVVQRNLSTALIMEDDVDWDVRIKGQMDDFAKSSRTLVQPLEGGAPGRYADPTFPRPRPDSPGAVDDIPFAHLPPTVPPSVSPYGDDWDVLWLGHCGVHFPFPDNAALPKGRVVHADDPTAPMRRYLWSIIQPFRLVEDYPEHTRVISHAQEGVCTLAYAVSQRGARKLLADVALREVHAAYDLLLRFFCDAPHSTCLTIQPGLFHHHRPAGPRSATSDIGSHEGWDEESGTDMVRWSVRMNQGRILAGETEMHDALPDGP